MVDYNWLARPAAILYYDYMITLGEEVTCFWRRRERNWTDVLFFTNRYVQLFGTAGMILETFGEITQRVSELIVETMHYYIIDVLMTRGNSCPKDKHSI